ncbi:hypothetical protein CERSUDRAFT_115685 [Gelatoporia subvermispora B]|uniref:SURP motif domain-containing protein n=1 Tax=Ceriporiopsis subvermispora (strain B) TaxID=914234 RepID=M2RBD4_CERS8|nr:hypothetical protein CERSUDRAFT_115685 [Gelatoporia subvermispora B]
MTLKGKRKEKDEEKQELRGVWVDRYDVRLLLDALPEIPPPSEASPPGSPTGWSDLPSDAEDTFFFSREEAEDYHREKRRRLIDQGREARLAALRAEAGDDADASPEDQWGGSDEEPDEPQRELMRRTAAHVLGSPNPAQLELRILANHGADPRFAFLRGRWSRAWRTAKGRVRLEKEQEAKERREQTTAQKPASALGGLTGYGDSDAEDSGEEGADPVPTQNSGEGGIEKADPAHSDVLSAGDMPAETESAEETIKKARRDRAREWAEKRRAAKIAAGDDSDI